MNLFLFYLLNLDKNARCYNNFWITKMPTETCQMLWACHWNADPEATQALWQQWHDAETKEDVENNFVKVYKKSHSKHPSTLWVGSHINNWTYACKMGLAMCKEYTFRYKKTHATEVIIKHLLGFPPPGIDQSHIDAVPEKNPWAFKLPFPCAISCKHCKPDGFDDNPLHAEDMRPAIMAYRRYFKHCKMHLYRYTDRAAPDFLYIDETMHKKLQEVAAETMKQRKADNKRKREEKKKGKKKKK